MVTSDDSIDQVVQDTPGTDVDNRDALLIRLQRTCRLVISSDYVAYLQEHEFDIDDTLGPTTYQ